MFDHSSFRVNMRVMMNIKTMYLQSRLELLAEH